MRKLLIASLSTMSLVSSCDKPVERPSPTVKKEAVFPAETNRLNSSNQEVIRTPTNPLGGLLEGKTPNVSTEEDLRRIAVNAALPVTLGEAVAGITFKTNRQDSKAILSNPKFSTATGIDVFGEGIQVTWGEGINPTPKSIRVVEGYKGAIALPAPYGMVALGQDLSGLLATDADKIAFTKAIGTTLSGKDASYDCIEAQTCLLENRAGTLFIDYPNATVIVMANALYRMDFEGNESLAPKATTPIVFDTSMGGINFSQKKEDIVKVYGEPYRYAASTKELFNAKTIRIVFTADNSIAQMEATKGFKGTIKIGQKEFGLGSTMAEFMPADDLDGLKMMATLAQKILGKDETYDCSKVMPATCQSLHNPKEKWIKVLVGNTIFLLSDDPSRTLLTITIFNPA